LTRTSIAAKFSAPEFQAADLLQNGAGYCRAGRYIIDPLAVITRCAGRRIERRRHEAYNSDLHLSATIDLICTIQLQGSVMQSIPVGATGSFSLVVMPDNLASSFKDVTLPPVLATPVMIMVMENAALNAIKPYLDAGESALGTHVDVRHLAATPVGQRVTGEAKVTNVDGRRIKFSIRATDGNEEIGVGTHERVVVQLAKLSERMRAKFG
jgi:fluoroacetyl-CoA thioesterase